MHLRHLVVAQNGIVAKGPLTPHHPSQALDAIVLARQEEEGTDLAENPHKLPPLAGEDANDETPPPTRGDILIFKSDDESEPVDFTVAEWDEYVADPTAEKYEELLRVRRCSPCPL